MADKSTRLTLDALARAAAEGPALPLLAHKNGAGGVGLFPANASGKIVAQRALDDGLLSLVGSKELAAITDKGRAFLAERGGVREILSDFVRVLEARQAQADELLASVARMRQSLDDMRAVVGSMSDDQEPTPAEKPVPAPATPPDPAPAVLVLLARRLAAGAADDCPLPELFRYLRANYPGLTVGQFHDALRRLHDDERLYLHPWTGPLYDLPEPAFALLVGHEVAFYASPRERSSVIGHRSLVTSQ